MNITVIGTGYVGLVAGCCFATKGNQVVCYDSDEKKMALLKQKQLPFYEPQLASLLSNGMERKKIVFTTSFKDAIAHGDIVFIAVGTPQKEEGGADLQALEEVVDKAVKILQQPKLLVLKSTVPIGTTNRLAKIAKESNARITVINNPEFLPEGEAVHSFLNPDRIIVGTEEPAIQGQMLALYKSLALEDRVLFMSALEAEFTKYAANAMLATRISFMNELAELADQTRLNFRKVQTGVGLDHRIGSEYLSPGIGYGGSCLTKDLNALLDYASAQGVGLEICKQVQSRNRQQKKKLLDLAVRYYNGVLQGKTFALWGLAFKPNTSDIRDSPSKVLIDELLQHGAKVQVYDPKANLLARHRACGVIEASSQHASLQGADALFICTDWDEFKRYPYESFQNKLTDKVIFDGRNIYSEKDILQSECKYFSIGFSHEK
jgi:UDPglucose 6-dehydrogenase